MVSGRLKKHQAHTFTAYLKPVGKLILFIVFVAALFLALNEYKSAKYFPITAVKVFGIKNADQKELQRALFPLVNKGFFAIDVDTIKDRLLQSPWISHAVVQRKWPNQVSVVLTERQPVARWKNSLLSTQGEIFTPDMKTYPLGLPHLLGPEGQQLRVLDHYKSLSAMLKPLNSKITRLELTRELSWNVMFENGIKLGVDHKDILTRINHFVKVYPKIVGSRTTDVEYIDLRYPNGLAVRWKSVT